MNWALADQILNSAQNFAIGLAIARLGGIEAFGAFTLVFVIAMLVSLLQDEFLAAPMMTYAGRRKLRTQNYYSGVMLASLALALGGGLLVGAIVAGMVGYRDGSLPVALALSGAAATTATAHFTIVKRLLFARGAPRAAFMLSAGRAGLLFLPVPLLLALNVDLSAEVWLLLIAASGALASIIPTVRHLPTARIRFGLLRAMLKKHWIYAQWLILMVGVAMAQEQFVWIWVGALEGDKAVGGMRAGQYLLGLTHVIMMGMHNFVAVEAAKAYTAGGHGSLTRYLAQQTIVLGALVGGIILMLALFAETWMRLVFGEEFVPFASTMRWFCLIYTVVFVREVWVMYLRTMEATRAIFVAFAFSSLFALIGTYPAIKLGGIGGALGVILIAHTISLVLIMMAIAAARR